MADHDPGTPDIEIVHKDIALGNSYRLELSKSLLALSTGLFAFTIAFPPAISVGTDITLLRVGWLCLAASMAGGLGNLYGWEKFYLTYRDYDFKGLSSAGKCVRRKITFLRRLARAAQFLGFLLGAFAIGWFTADNIQYAPVDKSSPAQVIGSNHA